ncbi:hypothetical protein [Streptomyces sp. NPDC054784]
MSDHNPRYADGCDRCFEVVAPSCGIAAGGSLTASYRCRCGQVWACSWRLVPGRGMPPQPGQAAA